MLRSTNAEKRSKLTKDLIDQAFAAWKENADSILSFDPYSVSQIENSKSDEERKQAPFYRGVAFIHPVSFLINRLKCLSYTYNV